MPKLTYKILDFDPNCDMFTVRVNTDDPSIQSKESIFNIQIDTQVIGEEYMSLFVHRSIMKTINDSLWKKWKDEVVPASVPVAVADLIGLEHSEEYTYDTPPFNRNPYGTDVAAVDDGSERLE